MDKYNVVTKKKALAATLAAALLAVPFATQAVPGDAKPGGVEAGFLTCNVASGWGFVIGSSRKLQCVWEPQKGVAYYYTGDVGQFGVDIGYHRSSVLLWTVVAATSEKSEKTLDGSYGGVTAQASAGVGAGVSALVGGFDKAITLQPLAISGETGLNAAAGIQTITLKHTKV